MDGLGVRLGEEGGCGLSQGAGLTAAVKVGNAGFRIESYGIFVSRILDTLHFCSK